MLYQKPVITTANKPEFFRLEWSWYQYFTIAQGNNSSSKNGGQKGKKLIELFSTQSPHIKCDWCCKFLDIESEHSFVYNKALKFHSRTKICVYYTHKPTYIHTFDPMMVMVMAMMMKMTIVVFHFESIVAPLWLLSFSLLLFRYLSFVAIALTTPHQQPTQSDQRARDRGEHITQNQTKSRYFEKEASIVDTFFSFISICNTHKI